MTDGGYGRATPFDFADEFNSKAFQIKQALALVNVATLVKVIAVHGGGLGPSGTVDVLPLVNLTDGLNQPTPQVPAFGLPFWRLQGGTNAVICDPVIGDLGLVIFADRDITNVKTVFGQANPATRRRFSMADGIYLGGVPLNSKPVQYVMFTTTGVTVVDKNDNIITMSPTGMTIEDVNENIISMTAAGIMINGILFKPNGNGTFQGHEHSGITSGPANTLPPVVGT